MSSPNQSHILDSAKKYVKLYGLLRLRKKVATFYTPDLSSNKLILYETESCLGVARAIELFFDDQPVASTVCIEAVNSVQYIVGFYTLKKFRGIKFDIGNSDSGYKEASAARVMLEYLICDALDRKKLLCLEVLNSNIPACKLYDNVGLLTNIWSKVSDAKLRPLKAAEIEQYARVRKKKIGRLVQEESSGCDLVKWAHVPSWGGVDTWSLNRVYISTNMPSDTLFSLGVLAKYRGIAIAALDMLVSTIRKL